MLPTEALAEIASVSGAALGLRESSYPAKGLPPKYPGLVILWGEAAIQYQSTEQYWVMQVRGLLMTGLTNDSHHHVNEVDPLVVKIVDTFAPGTAAFSLRKANGDQVDTCMVTSVSASQEIGYAGLQHYGAIINWEVQMRRFNP